MPRKINYVKSVTWAEARDLIAKRIEEGLITVHHDRVYQYLDKFALISAEDSRKMVEELVSEVGLDEDVAVVIANICPLTPGEVRSILEMRREMKWDESAVKKILEIVQKYCLGASGEE